MKVTVPSPKYAEERLPGSDESLGSWSLPYWYGRILLIMVLTVNSWAIPLFLR